MEEPQGRRPRGDALVAVRVRGRQFEGGAWAETGGDTVARGLGTFLAEFPATAGRYGVGLDADGWPLAREVEAAAREGGAVMVVVEAPQAA